MDTEVFDEPIFERFGGYEILARPGRSDRLVLSVSSLGLPDGRVPFEWRRLLADVIGDDHAVFLRDVRQSWYNGLDGWDALVAWLLNYQARHAIRHTTAFGLSMGGSGALILSRFLRIDRVVALGPQVVLGEEAGFDRRYQPAWSRAGPLRWPRIAGMVPQDVETICAFSLDIAEDILHAVALGEALPSARLIAFRGEHNLGSIPYARECTREFMREILGPDANFREVGGQEPAHWLPALARTYCGTDAQARDIEMREAVSALPAGDVPAFAYPWIQAPSLEEFISRHGSYGAALVAWAAPAHIGRYALGGAEIYPYLPFGWSGLEHWGVWSIGRWHVIRARVLDEPPVTRLSVILDFRIWLPDSRPFQTVRIWTGGQVVHAERLDGLPGSCIDRSIRIACDGPLAEILIETPDAISPLETTETNQDPRRLAIGLTRLIFAPEPRLAP